MALTKDDIIDRFVVEFNLQRREAVDLVDTMLDQIKTEVSEGKRVKFAGFGSFFLGKKTFHRKTRDIPVTDETERWRLPSFTASKALRARVQRAVYEEAKDVD